MTSKIAERGQESRTSDGAVNITRKKGICLENKTIFNEYSAKIMYILKLRHMVWEIMLSQLVYHVNFYVTIEKNRIEFVFSDPSS